MKVDERIAGTKQDRTEFNPPSAGERARSAETRRNASPENPKGRFRWFKPALGVTAAALGSIALGGTAVAVSVSEPGTTVGLALGAPLPEGVYFVDTSSDGGFRGVDDKRSDLFVTIPVIVWSTPWTVFGGRVWGSGFSALPFPSAFLSRLEPSDLSQLMLAGIS